MASVSIGFASLSQKRPPVHCAERWSPSAEGETLMRSQAPRKVNFVADERGKHTSGGFPVLNLSTYKTACHFLLQAVGAKESYQRKRRKGNFARCDERGRHCLSTLQAFWKRLDLKPSLRLRPLNMKFSPQSSRRGQ